MKRVVLPCVVLVVVLGCGGPFFLLPGGELSGTIVTDSIEDWSFLSDEIVVLETRPSDPYSVELSYVVRDGELFIDPAEGRRWLDNICEDPRVRVRFGDKIYPLKAVLAGKPGELPGFDAERFIYRLDPRDEYWGLEPSPESGKDRCPDPGRVAARLIGC